MRDTDEHAKKASGLPVAKIQYDYMLPEMKSLTNTLHLAVLYLAWRGRASFAESLDDQ